MYDDVQLTKEVLDTAGGCHKYKHILSSQNLLMVARLMSLGVQKSTLGLYWDCTPFRVDTGDHTFTTELYRQSMKEKARY